jgi:hypothetical protein
VLRSAIARCSSTAHGINDAGEFDQYPVAGGFDDTAMILGDVRVAEFTPDRPQRGESSLLISLHQSRIPRDISCQYRRQAPLDPLLDHGVREIFLFRVATQIVQRHHRNRRLLGQGKLGSRRTLHDHGRGIAGRCSLFYLLHRTNKA